ncbi:uncharacterized protein [Ptychodera flava]|uniref:uncharacterized protein n=1 Tax=Ptychodera flava TaxID=63121 RepID=UPI00396A08AE
MRTQASVLGVHRDLIRRCEQSPIDPENVYNKQSLRRNRSDRLSLDVISKIKDFYQQSDVSRELPMMQRTSKKKAEKQPTRVVEKQPTRVMEMTTERAHKKWVKDNPDNEVSLTTFRKLKPINVKPIRKNQLNQCLCEKCTNIMLKLRTLNATLGRHQYGNLKIKDKYDLLNISLCEKQNGLHSYKCVSRQCEKCGVRKLRERLERISTEDSLIQTSWLKWETKKTSITSSGAVKQQTRKVMIVKDGTLADLIDELVEEASVLAKHLFIATWPCDGVAGAVKTAVRQAVIARQVIVGDASDMFKYCSEHLTKDGMCSSKRSFFFVPKGTINRSRPNRVVTKSVPGTQQLHAVRCVQSGVIEVRHLSCFCEKCMTGDKNKECTDVSYVGGWKEVQLKIPNISSHSSFEARGNCVSDIPNGGGSISDGDMTPGVSASGMVHGNELMDNDDVGDMADGGGDGSGDGDVTAGVSASGMVHGNELMDNDDVGDMADGGGDGSGDGDVTSGVSASGMVHGNELMDNDDVGDMADGGGDGSGDGDVTAGVSASGMVHGNELMDNDNVGDMADCGEDGSGDGDVTAGVSASGMVHGNELMDNDDVGDMAEGGDRGSKAGVSNVQGCCDGNTAAHTGQKSPVYDCGIKPGVFVAIKLKTLYRSHNIFIAQVTAVSGCDLQLKYLRKVHTNVYAWPDKDDLSWEPMQAVIRAVTLNLRPGRLLQFSLCDEAFTALSDIAEKQKHKLC